MSFFVSALTFITDPPQKESLKRSSKHSQSMCNRLLVVGSALSQPMWLRIFRITAFSLMTDMTLIRPLQCRQVRTSMANTRIINSAHISDLVVCSRGSLLSPFFSPGGISFPKFTAFFRHLAFGASTPE